MSLFQNIFCSEYLASNKQLWEEEIPQFQGQGLLLFNVFFYFQRKLREFQIKKSYEQKTDMLL